ncbi:MAG: hypothetical protein AABX32_05000 [Nanoarchaeota archaeon]
MQNGVVFMFMRVGDFKDAHKRAIFLQRTGCVTIEKVTGYDPLPPIAPIQNQVHFFPDGGLEAVVSESNPDKPTYPNEKVYGCILTNPRDRYVAYFNYRGAGFEPLVTGAELDKIRKLR